MAAMTQGESIAEAAAIATETERERCAWIAETEPEPEGPMPVEFNRHTISDIVRGTVRATRTAIAARIRRGDQ